MKTYKRVSGFTLLELLLIVALLSVISVVVVLNFNPAPQSKVKEEATRLYHLIQLLSDDAQLNGIDFGVRIEHHSYQFLQLTGPDWQPIAPSRYFTQVELDEAITLHYELGSDAWQDQDRLFKPSSLFIDDLFVEESEQDKVKPPQIMVMASGEYTPFRLSFDLAADDASWAITVDESSVLYLLAPGDTIESQKQRQQEDPQWQ